jgi:hypothetical protein
MEAKKRLHGVKQEQKADKASLAITDNASLVKTGQSADETSLGLIYDIAIKSYEVLEKRYQAMDSRIQMVLSFAVGLVVVVLTLMKSILEHPNFSSKLFLGAMSSFVVAVALALTGAFAWPLKALRPKRLYDKFRQYPPAVFKEKLIYVAGEDYEKMVTIIKRKRMLALGAIILFVIGSALLVAWALRTPISIPIQAP